MLNYGGAATREPLINFIFTCWTDWSKLWGQRAHLQQARKPWLALRGAGTTETSCSVWGLLLIQPSVVPTGPGGEEETELFHPGSALLGCSVPSGEGRRKFAPSLLLCCNCPKPLKWSRGGSGFQPVPSINFQPNSLRGRTQGSEHPQLEGSDPNIAQLRAKAHFAQLAYCKELQMRTTAGPFSWGSLWTSQRTQKRSNWERNTALGTRLLNTKERTKLKIHYNPVTSKQLRVVFFEAARGVAFRLCARRCHKIISGSFWRSSSSGFSATSNRRSCDPAHMVQCV